MHIIRHLFFTSSCCRLRPYQNHTLQQPSPAADTVIVPNFDHALVYGWRGDNSGPPESVDEVLGNFQTVRAMFPGANVYASTFENFTDLLQSAKQSLPVITQDLEDTWLFGKGCRSEVKKARLHRPH